MLGGFIRINLSLNYTFSELGIMEPNFSRVLRKIVIPLTLVFFVLISSISPVFGQTPSSELFSLEFNTPSETGLDIIFLPEDYTLLEMDKFQETVETYSQSLLSTEPFSEFRDWINIWRIDTTCLLYTSPSPRDRQRSRMPSSA